MNHRFTTSIACLAIFGTCLVSSMSTWIPGLPYYLPRCHNPPDDVPDSGICQVEVGLTCENPGAKVAYNGTECCLECICEKDIGVTCCRTTALPSVKNPKHCTFYLNPDTCIYELTPKCKGDCTITGYYYSDPDNPERCED